MVQPSAVIVYIYLCRFKQKKLRIQQWRIIRVIECVCIVILHTLIDIYMYFISGDVYCVFLCVVSAWMVEHISMARSYNIYLLITKLLTIWRALWRRFFFFHCPILRRAASLQLLGSADATGAG